MVVDEFSDATAVDIPTATGDHGEKKIGIWAQPDVVMIGIDRDRKPNEKITTSFGRR